VGIWFCCCYGPEISLVPHLFLQKDTEHVVAMKEEVDEISGKDHKVNLEGKHVS
jgi:hypothetical protein